MGGEREGNGRKGEERGEEGMGGQGRRGRAGGRAEEDRGMKGGKEDDLA